MEPGIPEVVVAVVDSDRRHFKQGGQWRLGDKGPGASLEAKTRNRALYWRLIIRDLRVTPKFLPFLPPPTLSAMAARTSVPAPCEMSIAVHPKTGIRLQSGS